MIIRKCVPVAFIIAAIIGPLAFACDRPSNAATGAAAMAGMRPEEAGSSDALAFARLSSTVSRHFAIYRNSRAVFEKPIIEAADLQDAVEGAVKKSTLLFTDRRLGGGLSACTIRTAFKQE